MKSGDNQELHFDSCSVAILSAPSFISRTTTTLKSESAEVEQRGTNCKGLLSRRQEGQRCLRWELCPASIEIPESALPVGRHFCPFGASASLKGLEKDGAQIVPIGPDSLARSSLMQVLSLRFAFSELLFGNSLRSFPLSLVQPLHTLKQSC